MQKDQFNCPTK